jgi:thimet oligopeptidase
MRILIPALLAATALAPAANAAPDARSKAADAFVAKPLLTPATPAEITAACDARLAFAARLRTALETMPGKPTLETAFRRFDDLTLVLDAAGNDAGLLAEVAPDEPRREAARACQAKVGDAGTAISLSRPIYDRLKAIDVSRADATAKLLLTRALKGYERAGVALDDAGRGKVGQIQSSITAAGIKFEANIANGRKTISATPAELTGLPADYVANHKPDAAGAVTISTDTPDYVPVMSYARDPAVRKRLMEAYLTRAYPTNEAVLTDLFGQRDTLAKMLGRPNFATLALEDKMVDTPAKATALLDEMSRAADVPAHRDYDRMLARLKQDEPGATELPLWSSSYVSQMIRKEGYSVDPQEVRKYFPYEKVRDGLFRLTEDLFKVTIRKWDAPVWTPDAEAYEMVDHGQVIGHFYLDAHPRPGKYGHANVVPLRMGLTGRTLPMGALVVNFPSGGYKTGLMEHRDVETFLHEYGHLLHLIFGGKQQWELASPFNLEWDFVEAPSQMLENWVWDYDTLKRFAVDEQGNVIPADLVAKMNRARYFAEAFGDRRQLGLSAVSLGYHLGPPPADLTAAYNQLDRFSLMRMPAGTHQQDSFNHLSGYSAFYYTYMWSKVIAVDLFSRFEKDGLRDPATALDYRTKVLGAGASKPAADLVKDFLGRPISLDAYRARLGKGS